MDFASNSNRAIDVVVVASCVVVAACAGQTNLGEDHYTWAAPDDERWGAENVTSDELETLYRGSREVLDLTVHEGSLFALLRTPTTIGGNRFGVELVQCSADACDSDLRTLWHGTEPNPAIYDRLLARPPEIFWVNEVTFTVVGCSIDDCQEGPRTLGPITWPSELEADADFVYWVHDVDTLIRCPHTGCRSTVPFEQRIGLIDYEGLARVERFGDSLYVGNDGGRRIIRIDAQGNEETLYETQQALAAFDVDGDGVYFATSLLTGNVLRCPLKGACGAGEVLARGQRWPETVLVDAGMVAWANTSGDDVKVMKLVPGSSPAQVTTRAGSPGSIAVGGGHLYWAESSAEAESIRRVAR